MSENGRYLSEAAKRQSILDQNEYFIHQQYGDQIAAYKAWVEENGVNWVTVPSESRQFAPEPDSRPTTTACQVKDCSSASVSLIHLWEVMRPCEWD
jgi:hypothetical protein